MSKLLVADYNSDSESDSGQFNSIHSHQSSKLMTVNAAPSLITTGTSGVSGIKAGPVDFFKKPMDEFKNTYTGIAESFSIDPTEFDSRRQTFNNLGYTIDPAREFHQSGSSLFYGDCDMARQMHGAYVNELSSTKSLNSAQTKKKRRLDKGIPSDIDGFRGPWAGYDTDMHGEMNAAATILPSQQQQRANELSQEEELKIQRQVQETIKLRTEAGTREGRMKYLHKDKQATRVRQQVHLAQSGWINPPIDVPIDFSDLPIDGTNESLPNHYSLISKKPTGLPKSQAWSYSGHTSGVQCIRFFPETGHLLLSAGLDSELRIWDVYHGRKCLQVYKNPSGSGGGILDARFDSKGRQFVSSAADRVIRIWDTETGNIVREYQTKVPSKSVLFGSDNSTVYCAGGSDYSILQFDTRLDSLKPVRSLTGHSAPITSLQRLPNDKILSSSNDRTVRLWDVNGDCESGKVLLENANQPVVSLGYQSTDDMIVCQSLDDQIFAIPTTTKTDVSQSARFKKRMVGFHLNGNSCQISVSRDGKYVISGDSNGQCIIWDWNSCKIAKKIKCHGSAVVSHCEWHPVEPNKLATCSLDGTIKLFH